MDINELEFTFQSEADDIFSSSGKTIPRDPGDAQLRHRVGAVFKKCVLSDVVHVFLTKHKMQSKSTSLEFVKWVSFLLLLMISPKTTRVFQHDFTEIVKFLHNEQGLQYFYASDMENNADFKLIINALTIEGFITKRDEKLYITGYYLEDLRFIQ